MDSDNLFPSGGSARLGLCRLAENKKIISDEQFYDIVLRGIASDYEHGRNTSYHNLNFGLRGMQFIMRLIDIYGLSRKGKPKAAERGAAMLAHNPSSAANSRVRCCHCDKPGHRRSERLHLKHEPSASTAVGSAKPKVVLLIEAPINKT